MKDVDTPMSNTELRLTFADIKSEIAEVKSIGIDTHSQAKKTNGRVNLLEKFMWVASGALLILTPIVGWLAVDYLNHRDQVPSLQVQTAVETALDNYIAKTK